MIGRFGAACARWAQRWVPHPFVFAILLNVLVLIVGMIVWRGQDSSPVKGVLAAWYDGFWTSGLLAFGFQMALILVTGYAVAGAPLTRRLLDRLAGLWTTPRQAVALTAAVSVILSWLHWGLGLVGAAFLAREVASVARRRRTPIPYPLICASAYAGFLVWHGGLSGSAPLVVAQASHSLSDLIGTVPLSQTVLAPGNLVLSAVLLAVIPLILAAMTAHAPLSIPPAAMEAEGADAEEGGSSPAARWNRSGWVTLAVLVPAFLLAGWILVPGWVSGGRGFDLNAVLFVFLFAGLALHRSPLAYVRAIQSGAGEAGGILLQFPFYFALLGVMKASGLVALLSDAGVAVSLRLASVGLPADGVYRSLTFLVAGLVNLFVPSGGGQWAVQGEIVVRGALDPQIHAGVGRSVMALAYGDAWTNMLQPFWALVLLSVTGTRARDILGYTMALMVLVAPVYLIYFWF
ncbi:MAG: short-chain fatty acid transporter [Candidatus Eisenbacteria bacterium]|uniref:Short-chain fatty acid transporter n=1 Tax=Eiseniibacteriota bacterium TaxID=2212470 RepID=A0A956M0H2_UNCEI|nr:short-chain fatty acid transporter [Candidatus Eisenbacteria bacterium]